MNPVEQTTSRPNLAAGSPAPYRVQLDEPAATSLLEPGDQFGQATIYIEVDADGHLVSNPRYEYAPSKLETVGTALLGLAKCEEERQPILDLLARLRQYDNVRLAVTGPGAEAFAALTAQAKLIPEAGE